MWRNILCAVFVVALCFGLVSAAEIKGKITKVDGNKVTVVSGKKGMTEEKVYDLAKDVKVYRAEGKDKKEEVKGGVADIKLLPKGNNAMITTDSDNKVTQIVLTAPKKKDAK